MQRPESVSIDDIAPDSRKRYNKNMNSNEEKKEYRTPEFVYVEFAYSDVVIASMGMSGTVEHSDEPLGGK